MIGQTPGRSFYCTLPLLNCRRVTMFQFRCPCSPSHAVRGLCLSSQWTGAPSPEASRAVSGLQVISFCRILAVTLVLWMPQPNIVPRWTHHLAKTGWICGCCRTCFWVKGSAPTLIYLFIWRKRVCILWGKENMMIIFWLESDIVSLIVCCLLTNSIPLKYSFACWLKCCTRSCGYVLKYTTLFRGRCLFKLFASFSSLFTLSLLWGDSGRLLNLKD